MMVCKKGIAVFFLFIIGIGAIFASNLMEVETSHFTIIYDESSKESAALIASECEDTYEDLCSLFKVDPDLHLPVILTTQTKVLNAYFTTSPSSHIVLYDVVASKGSLTSFSETLTSIFKHELTHAFTMNLRSSFWQVLANIFGDSVNPSNFLYAYQSMTEGIAVTTESLEGYGRMNDFYSYRIVSQAKLEGNFPSWIEICGARDTYPASLLPYIFGGAFLTYLCDSYGTDVVYEIFVKFGKINWFKDTAKIIEDTVGVKFEVLWNGFYESIEVPTNLFGGSELSSYKKAGSFDGLKALSDGSVVFHDSASYSLYKLTSDLGKCSKLIDFLSYGDDFCISDDGSMLLIPYVLETSNCVKVVSEKGKVLKTFSFEDKDARGGVFTDDGVLLYVAKEQETFFELYDSNYEFVASVSLGYGAVASSLTDCKNGQVAFIYTLNGEDSLAFLNTSDLSIELYESPVSMRIFSLALAYGTEESLLSFSWFPASGLAEDNSTEGNSAVEQENNGPILGGYGEFLLEDCSFRLSKANVSGGVNSPLRLNDTVLFAASYYEGDALSTISVKTLALEEKIITSHSTLEAQGFDASKFEILSSAKKYKPFENMNSGTLLPFGSYADGSLGLGMTWSTTDPTGQYTFNMTGFSDALGLFNLGLWAVDNLKVGPIELPIIVGTRFVSGYYYFNFQAQPSYAYYFDAGKYLQVSDTIADTLILYNAKVANFFNNVFAISYTNATSTGLGLNKTKGYAVQFTLENINPSFNAKVKFPVFCFGLTLSGAVQYNVISKNLSLAGSANINLFNLEIQNGTRVLQLYIKRLTLDAQYSCDYSVTLKTFGQTIELRAYATLAPLLGGLSSSLELKLGAVLAWNPLEGSPTVTFTVIQ